jgi:hypothetical protein
MMWISKKNFNKEVIKTIQAIGEGERLDVLTSGVTSVNYAPTGDTYIDKNNYPTYTKQVQVINQMYNNETDYASELTKSVIDTRLSFIGGAGISVKGTSKKTVEFVTKFLEFNKLLKGSELLNVIKIGEMEGKCLIKLKPSKFHGKDVIRTISFDWYNNPYDVEMINKEVTKITLAKGGERGVKSKGTDNNQNVPIDEAIYVKLGGSPDRVNETPPKLAVILTDLVNMSRAKYDTRGNNHLYGRPQWVGLTNTAAEAKALNNTINGKDMTRGKSYVGTAREVFYLEPSGKAQGVLEKEILLLARIISMNTGIPIHWLAWPDLMSNRATAENMLEMINAATVQERLIWEEGLTELTRKAMVMGFEKGMEGAVNDPFGFELKLDLVSYANLKQIQDTWIPLAEGDYVSKQTAMSLIPGIDPVKEAKLIEKEKEKRMEDMPTVMQPNSIKKDEDEKENDTEKE